MAKDEYGAHNKTDQNDWGGWLAVIILLMIPNPLPWLLGFGLLIRKLRGGKRVGNGVKRHPYDVQQEQQKQAAWEERQGTQGHTSARTGAPSGGQRSSQRVGAARGPSRPTAPPSPLRKSRGTGLIAGGALLSAFASMGLAGAVSELLSFVEHSGYVYSGDAAAVAFGLVMLAGGLGMLLSGLGRRKRGERCVNYLAYIGANREVELARMAASMDVSVRKLVKDLRWMLAKGVLPTGYLDLAEGKLYLTEMGYRAPEPPRAEEPPQPSAPQSARAEDHAILREIRQINDDIPGELMSAKIDRIEEITGKILAYQEKYPQREGQLRSFLNYYLPTTLKILRSYAQLDAQGVEGENISAAKTRIEGMMDQVVAGFEAQLDKLFQGEAMDITTDVEVLENMLRSDGLSGGEGMTLEL